MYVFVHNCYVYMYMLLSVVFYMYIVCRGNQQEMIRYDTEYLHGISIGYDTKSS